MVLAIATTAIGLLPAPAAAQDYGLEGEARWTLNRLMATVPQARMLEQRAYATLVFPDVTKAGFLIGGEYGNGVLFRRGGVYGYYNTAGVSYGLQAGCTDVQLRHVLHERVVMAGSELVLTG